MELVSRDIGAKLNVVYKNDSDNIRIPSIALRNVSLRNFLEVLEVLADVNVEVINETKGELSPHGIIVLQGKGVPSARLNLVPSVSRVRLPNKSNPAPNLPQTLPTPAPETPARALPAPSASDFSAYNAVEPKQPTQTRVISLAHLKLEPEEVIDIIRTAWEVADPNEIGETVLYKKTKLLIIKATPERMTEAELILETLGEQADQELQTTTVEFKRKYENLEREFRSRLDDAKKEIDTKDILISQLTAELNLAKARLKQGE